MENGKQVYTVPETAEILGISRTTAYQYVEANVIPHLRIGKRIIVPSEALKRWLASIKSEED